MKASQPGGARAPGRGLREAQGPSRRSPLNLKKEKENKRRTAQTSAKMGRDGKRKHKRTVQKKEQRTRTTQNLRQETSHTYGRVAVAVGALRGLLSGHHQLASTRISKNQYTMSSASWASSSPASMEPSTASTADGGIHLSKQENQLGDAGDC